MLIDKFSPPPILSSTHYMKKRPVDKKTSRLEHLLLLPQTATADEVTFCVSMYVMMVREIPTLAGTRKGVDSWLVTQCRGQQGTIGYQDVPQRWKTLYDLGGTDPE